MAAFMSGIELCRRFYHDAVRPILDSEFSGLPHSAALLGRGSEVLGFDDEMSGDHNWEPRVLVFLEPGEHGDAVNEALRRRVPEQFGNRPTTFQVATLRSFILDHLDVDLDQNIAAPDWLTFPEHRILMLTAGAVYHDEVGLQVVRDRFAYYPRDVWLYLLVTGWRRIHPEANIVGRIGYVGDELGSTLVGARLVTDIMRLCFLMEKQYAPYSKWFGTAFSRLACAEELSPILWRVVRAESWQEREKVLKAAYEKLAAMHNALDITEPVATEPYQMWNRPFTVLYGDFPSVIRAQIQDPAVQRIVERWPVGPIDRMRDLLWATSDRRSLLRIFR